MPRRDQLWGERTAAQKKPIHHTTESRARDRENIGLGDAESIRGEETASIRKKSPAGPWAGKSAPA